VAEECLARLGIIGESACWRLCRYRHNRHTFASHLVSRNWSLPLVGKLLGHTQGATTERYAHIADVALRNVANDFGEVLVPLKGKTSKKDTRADLVAGRVPALLEAVPQPRTALRSDGGAAL
jgi:hypothetical protein